MPLTPTTRLGPYEIVALLGAGGMGEVYLARDTRLARDVAIKVLPSHLAGTPEARAGLEREARAVSSLNHPNICTLYDVGNENGIDFLVLERIDGETLQSRLERGALPIQQVLQIGMEIADALDRAHRSGLVHRDLKPGNVMLTKRGAKLLDFGLARAAHAALSASPNLVTQAMTMGPSVTAEGKIAGTFQYMAPEQLEGKDADARSDLWALGCVLHEMATAKRAFAGESQASLISAIMSGEPVPISRVTPLAPPGLDRLVRACLEKDRSERIQSAHDVKLQLRWIGESTTDERTIPPPRSKWGGRVAWAGASLALASLATLGTLALHRPRADRDAVRFLVARPTGQVALGPPVVSHDGRMIAFTARDSASARGLWVRPLDALEAREVLTADLDGSPIWAPDNASLAYVSKGKLMRVPISGGAAVPIGDAPGRSGGAWSRRGVIVLECGTRDSLIAVSVADGAVNPASRRDLTRGDVWHGSPCFLPDGRHFLFVAGRLQQGAPSAAILLGRLGSLEAHELGPCDNFVEFDPPDHVIYQQGTNLVTRRLDLRRHVFSGEPVVLAKGLARSDFIKSFAVGGGVLAEIQVTGVLSELVWTDRTGRRLSRVAEPDCYRDISLSPDEQRVAFAVEDPEVGTDDVWIRDLDRGVSTRLTYSPAQETSPVWSADGTRIFYGTDRKGGNYLVYSVSANNPGLEDVLDNGNSGQEGPLAVSSDGKWLATASSVGATMEDWNIQIRDTQGKAPPRPLCASPAPEYGAAFSPDGRWLAYGSYETGQSEIYVLSFPDGLHKWRVSNAGGIAPHWARDGREILYRSPVGDIVSVPVAAGADFRPGKPVALFHADVSSYGWGDNRWAVTADGQRFLLNLSIKNPSPGFMVTKNWAAAVRS